MARSRAAAAPPPGAIRAVPQRRRNEAGVQRGTDFGIDGNDTGITNRLDYATMSSMWLGIDIGTGGSRALLVDERGGVRAGYTAPHEDMRMERPLWAEQRPENWWDAAVEAIRGVLAKAGVAGPRGEGHRALRPDARPGDPRRRRRA